MTMTHARLFAYTPEGEWVPVACNEEGKVLAVIAESCYPQRYDPQSMPPPPSQVLPPVSCPTWEVISLNVNNGNPEDETPDSTVYSYVFDVEPGQLYRVRITLSAPRRPLGIGSQLRFRILDPPAPAIGDEIYIDVYYENLSYETASTLVLQRLFQISAVTASNVEAFYGLSTTNLFPKEPRVNLCSILRLRYLGLYPDQNLNPQPLWILEAMH